jgi:lysophospholipid hydrolase
LLGNALNRCVVTNHIKHSHAMLLPLMRHADWQFYLLLDGHLLAERKVQAPANNSPTTPAAGVSSTAAGPDPAGSSAPPQTTPGQPPQQAMLTETGIIRPGSAISCAAFLSCTAARCRVVALEPARLLAFGWQVSAIQSGMWVCNLVGTLFGFRV